MVTESYVSVLSSLSSHEAPLLALSLLALLTNSHRLAYGRGIGR